MHIRIYIGPLFGMGIFFLGYTVSDTFNRASFAAPSRSKICVT